MCLTCLQVDRLIREEELYKGATRVRYLDYEGKTFYWEGGSKSYFSTRTELYEHCARNGLTPPRWVFGCKAVPLKLDATRLFESEEGHEARDLIDADEFGHLQGLIDLWAAHEGLESYQYDETTVVLLDQALYDQATWEPEWDPGDYVPYDASTAQEDSEAAFEGERMDS